MAELPEMGSVDPTDLERYREDPVGFGADILGHTYPEQIQEAMRSVVHNKVTIVRSAHQVGKSFAGADLAIWFYLVWPDSQVFLAAAPPVENVRRILWAHVRDRYLKHRHLFAGHMYRQSMVIERSPLSFLRGVTIPATGTDEEKIAKFSGKHSPSQLFVLDEGDGIPEAIYVAIEGCMSGGERPRLVVLFNPRHDGAYLARLERSGRANVVSISALEHENVTSGEQVIPGCVDRPTVAARIYDWCEYMGEQEQPECFPLPDFLVDYHVAPDKTLRAGWYKPVNPEFWYMVLGEYPPTSDENMFRREWIERATQNWTNYVSENRDQLDDNLRMRGRRPIMGIDPGMESDATAICFRYGDYVAPFTVWYQKDPEQVAEEAAELYFETNSYQCNVDCIGIGAGIAPGMRRRKCVAVPVDVGQISGVTLSVGVPHRLRDELWCRLAEWLRTSPRAMLPPDKLLEEELMAITAKRTGRGRIRVIESDQIRKKIGRSADRASALLLTFAANRSFFEGCIVEPTNEQGRKTVDEESLDKADFSRIVIGLVWPDGCQGYMCVVGERRDEAEGTALRKYVYYILEESQVSDMMSMSLAVAGSLHKWGVDQVICMPTPTVLAYLRDIARQRMVAIPIQRPAVAAKDPLQACLHILRDTMNVGHGHLRRLAGTDAAAELACIEDAKDVRQEEIPALAALAYAVAHLVSTNAPDRRSPLRARRHVAAGTHRDPMTGY